MTLSEIIKDMQGRHPTLVVAAHMETLRLLMEAEERMFDMHDQICGMRDRIAALETGQPTVFNGQYENTPPMEGLRNSQDSTRVERRKPGRPRKNLEANPG